MRRHVLPAAQGVVAEVGFGSGLNLAYYDPTKVERLIGVDPDAIMLDIARRKVTLQAISTELLQVGAESLPLDGASVDTAVVTYAFCTIPSPRRALLEIRRVLKPAGRLLFIEHGRSDQPLCRRLQDGLNGLWGHMAGGCNLNRDPPRLIEEAGFVIRNLQQTRFPLHLWQLGRHFAGEASPG